MKQWLKGAAVLATGILLISSSATAGPKPAGAPPAPMVRNGPPPPGANPLGLTPDQQTKLQALSMKMMPDIQAAMKNAKTEAQARKIMLKVQKKFEPEMMSILTPAQRTKVKALRAEAIKKMNASDAKKKAAAGKN